MREIEFYVRGNPIPKQSYRHSKHGGYQPKRVTEWQEFVAWNAKGMMAGNAPMVGPLSVWLAFARDNKRKVDLDNLSKAMLDAMNGIVYEDDQQIKELHLLKSYDKENPCVKVLVKERQ